MSVGRKEKKRHGKKIDMRDRWCCGASGRVDIAG